MSIQGQQMSKEQWALYKEQVARDLARQNQINRDTGVKSSQVQAEAAQDVKGIDKVMADKKGNAGKYAAMAQLGSQVADSSGSDAGTIAGSTASGAALGTSIAPGYGTAIGAGVGAVTGIMKARSNRKANEEARKQKGLKAQQSALEKIMSAIGKAY